MDGCLKSRTPGGPRLGLYLGLVLAGIGVGMVVGQGVAVASPADTEGTSQSDDASGDASTTAGPSSDPADAADDTSTDAAVDDTDAEADDADTDIEAEVEAAETAEAGMRTQSHKRSRATLADAAADDEEPSSDITAAAVEDTAEVDTTEAATEFAAAAPAPAVEREPTVGSLVSARPVTAESIVTDVLTWVGLRSADDDAPAPVTPVSGLVESLWLAVRQSQYTWNNQRPIAGVIMSGPGPDGVVAGNLNAVDYDDAALTYVLVSGPSHGRVVIDALGRFAYTPGAAAAGRADTFTIRVDDTSGNPFHVHGLLGLLGIARPTEVTVSIAATSPASLGIPSTLDIDGLSSRDGVEVTTGSAGAVRVIEGRFTDQVVVNAADAAAVLNALAPVLGAPSDFADLAEVSASTVGDGDTLERFYRFTETIGGITVLGSEVVLVTDADGDVTSVFNYYRALGDDFNITPDASIDEDAEVRRVASSAYLGPNADPASIGTFLSASTFTNDLVVYTVTDDETPALAWRVVVHVPDTGELAPSGATVMIHADGEDAGTVIVTVSNAQAAAAVTTAKDWLGDTRTITIDTRKVLWFSSSEMSDPTRNITTYKTSYGLFGLGSPVLPGKVVKRSLFGWDTSAVSAHANAAVVYDYFKNVLGRQSYDGDGAKIVISIRYRPASSPLGYTNAFWDPTIQQFAFGDTGVLQADVDIVAHEFTHAVISSILGDTALDSGQPGALNEAYADIFGVLVEGASGADRWLIAEDSGNGTIRNLADPTSVTTSYGPYRDRLSKAYTGSGDDKGEHVNSTIFSHAAYLMMTDAATVGVSDVTWAKVFYHSIPRLSATAQFADARAAVLSSASEQGLTLAQRSAIAAAFDTVEIYGAPVLSVAV
ncbi:M4 family metallopeptidase [Mycolicibacterium sp. BiH015]|uniref:M4 family metallopeptidase n=1 Tax=Mycolicibacterium sp. BiH015 TaxID=3018808 RepID=UPI0022E5ED30|nr:M4 family metallopeptidase [Mycolicibacterium sp. BiH015]MDA2890304.1 M4 family metallopeptidase [Mycolicibacterium sp. BiH015]